jgi:GntR family transcriptional repressor for pyruvate dehydrogenase complex
MATDSPAGDRPARSPRASSTPGYEPARRLARRRVADQIVEDLRERILSGALPDGSRLRSERELAEEYGVSGATVRESIRVLTAVGLVDTRHGSGSFVTAETDTMMALSMASMMRLAGVDVTEALGVLAALNRHAVLLAARDATDAEIASLREAAEKLAVIDDVDQTAEALRAFLRRLSEISHNPLLAALCRFLIDVQVALAIEASGGELETWRRVAGGLHAARLAVVDALASRDGERAAELVVAHAAQAVEKIRSTADAREPQVSDPRCSQLLSTVLTARLNASRR